MNKPPAITKKTAAQSASSIAAFKSCPMLYFLSYVKKLEPVVTGDALRQGTNWHKCLEILTMEPGGPCSCSPDAPLLFCPLCKDSGRLPDDLRLALVCHLNWAYETRPPSVEPEDWEIERITLLNSALGWQWYWQEDQVETLAREIWFERTLPGGSRRVGRIDRIVRRGRPLMLGEYKSTSKPIDSGSVYWNQLKSDPQLTLYLIEARVLQHLGKFEKLGIPAGTSAISGVLFDVWHKPQIRPKKLTQAESKKFIEDGEYCGQQFELAFPHELTVFKDGEPISTEVTDTFKPEFGGALYVNTVAAEIIPGKKDGTFAIRETPDMFGARLLADIQANPEKHFARREVARTDQELEQADEEFRCIERVTHLMTLQDLWYKNEQKCNATYRCPFFQICHYGLLPGVRDDNIPDGFKRKGT